MADSKARTIPNASSGNKKGYYGILNASGELWSHTVHGSEEEAREYVRGFWGNQTEHADECLRKFTIIPVRVTLEPLDDEA